MPSQEEVEKNFAATQERVFPGINVDRLVKVQKEMVEWLSMEGSANLVNLERFIALAVLSDLRRQGQLLTEDTHGACHTATADCELVPLVEEELRNWGQSVEPAEDIVETLAAKGWIRQMAWEPSDG